MAQTTPQKVAKSKSAAGEAKRERNWSAHELDVAASYNNMATVYEAQGRLGEALELHEKSLAIMIKVLGPEHADVATSYNNMAIVYEAQGRLGEALELFEKSLAIRIKVLGPEHADVAASYNNMAIVYKSQGRLGDQEQI